MTPDTGTPDTTGTPASGTEAALAWLAATAPRPQPIGTAEHEARLARLRAGLRAAGLKAAWLDASSSLRYFTGVSLGGSERIHGALIPAEGGPLYLTPAFEAPKLETLIRLPGPFLTWEEDEDPFALLAATLAALPAPGRGLAIDPATPFGFASRMAAALGAPPVSAEPLIAPLREVKSPAEIAIIEAAMQASLRVQRAVHGLLRPGIATTEVCAFIDAAHEAMGMRPLFAAVQFGAATAYPHGVPDPQRLAPGDMVLVDLGGILEGYRSDLTRTYVFGPPTPRQRDLWAVEARAQAAAFAAIRPGAPCHAVDDAARGAIAAAGFGPGYALPGLPHRTGHGLGLDIHEAPWMLRGNTAPLRPGMVFSIEPMLCLYGECGIRLEDFALVTETGARWLTPPSPAPDRPFG